jgi:hypothetical protein
MGGPLGPSGTEVSGYNRQFQQRAQFRQGRRIGPQLHHAYVFYCLKKTRLVVQQQYNSVGWIN